jgi:hypothetical protein
MRAKILAVSLIAGAAGARSSRAQDEVRFEYEAPPQCPQRAEFRARVRERLLGAGFETSATERPPSLVRVRVEPAVRRASVELHDADGSSVTRVVQGDTCDELVAGVALITALAFGAQSNETTPPPGEANPPAAEPEVATAPGVANQPAATQARRAQPVSAKNPKNAAASKRPAPLRAPANPMRAAGQQPADEAATAANPARLGAPRELGWDAGAGGWVSSWLSPTRTLGADLFLRLGGRGAGWSARLSGLYGAATARPDARRADFSFWGGRLEGCPLGVELWSSLHLEACAAAELGSLTGTGREESALREGAEQSVFWAAAVLAARLRAPVTRWVTVEAQAELGLPITSHEFVFEQPDRQVFQVPNVGGAGRIGLAVPFL